MKLIKAEKTENKLIPVKEGFGKLGASLKKNLTFSPEDRLLTLSTCTNGYYTQRYALHARLIDFITD